MEDKIAYHLMIIMYIIMLILQQCPLRVLTYTRGAKQEKITYKYFLG